VEILRNLLEKWYLDNHRKLPWRETKDPYKIWLSEIILQQTRVEQGLPYYQNFVINYPTVKDLASADDDDVMKLWEGLGYYSRARNLLVASREVINDLDGKFPTSYKNIIQLKGIGPYTAAAIASFAFNEAVAVVDGNVYRVLSRLFNDATAIDSNQGKKTFQLLADEFLNPRKADTHNQAIMELGAMVCTPKNPKCEECPLNKFCQVAFTEKWKLLPFKGKKVKVEKLFLSFQVCINNQSQVLIEKRTDKGIWQNLYQFPLLEDKNSIPEPKDFNHSSKEYKHLLSHRKIQAQFFFLDKLESKTGFWVDVKELDKYAFPKLIINFLNDQNWFQA
jgi:A/G-specific adenine glycosylase